MPENNETGSRKPRGSRKAARPAIADDWASVAATATEPGTAAPGASPPERQRVAKVMARAGLCSRRDAEAWILDGRVSVNGETLASPARDVGPEDRVEVDGAPLPTAEKTRLFLFHKPRGLVTSDHDPEGRETIFDHLRTHWPEGPRVVTVGRLDINTEGLLLLTNDGGLARILELPKTGWLRRYRVRANGETDQAQLDALAGGITIEGVDYAGIEARLDRVQGANCWLTMGLREGKNREIKRVLEHLGLEVNRLIRLSFGPFQLLDLAEGAVEEVRTRVLKDQLGAALASEAGVDFGEAPAAPAPAPTEPARIVKAETARPAKLASSPKTTSRERPASAGDRRSRGGDPRPQQSRANEGRGGERTMRRRDPATTPDVSEHNLRRPRRHVSALRTAEAEGERAGPRKRIERSDTRDRNDRTVTVERKVSARPARSTSPAAEGKRARIARSGAPRATRDDARGARAPSTRTGETGERRSFRGRTDEASRDGRGATRREASGREPTGRAPRTSFTAAKSTRSEGRGGRGEQRTRRDDSRGGDGRAGGERSRSARPSGRGDAGARREGGGSRPAGGNRTPRSPRPGGTDRRSRSDEGNASRPQPATSGAGRTGGPRPDGSGKGGAKPNSGRKSGPRPGSGDKGSPRPRGGAPTRPKR